MTDEQRRRIDDHRPAVGLQWDENNPPPRTPIERPEQWTILLTSGNHGLVGSYGHAFPHTDGNYERINVVDEAVAIKLRERVRELEAAGNTNKAVLTDEQIGKLGDQILSLHRQLAAEKLRADQGWERADAKSKECIELRERLAAPAPADNPSTAGAAKGYVTLEDCEKVAKSWDGLMYDAIGPIDIGVALRADFKRLAGVSLKATYSQNSHKPESINTPQFQALLEEYDDAVGPIATKHALAALVSYINSRLAAPALNPSDAVLALQTIADFPVTDLVANMEAWNMKNIAAQALKGAAAQSVEGGGRG